VKYEYKNESIDAVYSNIKSDVLEKASQISKNIDIQKADRQISKEKVQSIDYH
jgi:hypothetical protein